MKRTIILSILLISGCAPYVEVQSQLVEQTRRGVMQLESSLEQKSQIVAQHQAMQRRRVDEAFDADVRERSAISANWVIEHRRAYAAGLDALATARAASLESDAMDHRNLAAIRAALDRLHFLQTLQLRIFEGHENEQN